MLQLKNITKDYVLEGMLKISIFKGEEKIPDTGILTDQFTYTAHDLSFMDEPKAAYYNPDKFVHFDSVAMFLIAHWQMYK